MTYADIADIADSPSLRRRLTACAAEQGKPEPFALWVSDRAWSIAAAPGWASAWGSARAAGIGDIGADESVITDAMILSVVQPMGEAAPSTPVENPVGEPSQPGAVEPEEPEIPWEYPTAPEVDEEPDGEA